MIPPIGSKWRSRDHRNAGCPWLIVVSTTERFVVVQRHEDPACNVPRGRPVPTRPESWVGAGAPVEAP